MQITKKIKQSAIERKSLYYTGPKLCPMPDEYFLRTKVKDYDPSKEVQEEKVTGWRQFKTGISS